MGKQQVLNNTKYNLPIQNISNAMKVKLNDLFSGADDFHQYFSYSTHKYVLIYIK